MTKTELNALRRAVVKTAKAQGVVLSPEDIRLTVEEHFERFNVYYGYKERNNGNLFFTAYKTLAGIARAMKSEKNINLLTGNLIRMAVKPGEVPYEVYNFGREGWH